jgi:chaperone required for assembly of F1-ATPase
VKRFYKEVAVAPQAGGFALWLDGRVVKTPARRELLVPGEPLARAIAGEWEAQGETIDPRTMPLTGLANAAIDRVSPDPGAFARSLALFGESDLLCYRSEGPRSLVERETRSWGPVLDWACRRFEVDFEIASGVMHRSQPGETVARLAAAVAARNPFQLAALSPLVTISGSLVIALALAEGEIGLGTAWAAATLDESWQAENWGEDSLATAAIEARRREFEAAYRFLTLL